MAEYFHGVRAEKKPVQHAVIKEATSGIAFCVGAAPVHMVGGKVNEPVICNSWEAAISAFGYSSDWESFSLCQVMYNHFQVYNAGPVVFLNVLDPAIHRSKVEGKTVEVADHLATLPGEAISDTVQVLVGEQVLVEDTDYSLYYVLEDGALTLELLEGGSAASADQVTVTYEAADPSKLTKADVIGGRDVTTRKITGLEWVEYTLPTMQVIPDLLLCPGWSKDAAVAAVMAAKAKQIDCVYRGKALADVDSSVVTSEDGMAQYKAERNLTDPELILCWPQVRYGGKTYDMSVALAAEMTVLDLANDSVPCDSPSNYAANVDATVLADGTEIVMNLDDANVVNSQGVVTCLRGMDGFTFWGNHTAAYPDSTDQQDATIDGSRMFDYVCNSVIVKSWSRVDRRLSYRPIMGIITEINAWLDGLAADEKILGGRVTFLQSENAAEQLADGRIVFHVYLGTAPGARIIDYIVEQDLSYLDALIDSIAS